MKLLNSIGLPDEIGFEIYPNTFKNLFKCEKDYDEYILELQKKCSRIYEKYNLGNMNINGDVNICIKSYNGNKKIVTEKLCIINLLYNYFNNSTYKYNGKIYFNQNAIEAELFYENEIKELKRFISKKIDELKKVKSLEDIKNISNTLYQSNLDAINNIEPKNDILLQIVVERDIEKLKRLKLWLKDFIDDIANVPNDNSLYKNINYDKFKLYLVFQLMSLFEYLGDTNSVILAYNMVEIFNSIKDKTILFNDIEVVELDNDSNTSWKGYKNVNYDSLKRLIDNFLQNSSVKHIISGLKQFEKQNQVRVLNDSYYDKITDLIAKAVLESNKSGFKDIDLNNLNSAIKEELSTAPTLKKQNQLKSYIERIEFYLNETKPYKVQEGRGLFKNSHILYFTNGIVAVDRLNGEYGYLYIMPINTYLEILKKHEIKNLFEIRTIITVKPISHKKTNWKTEAYNEIKNHIITNDEFEILESIAGIMLPISTSGLEEAKRLYSHNQFILKKLTEKENEINAKLNEIDQELKDIDFSNYSEEMESNNVLDAENEISENIFNYDFVSIFDYDNKIKTKRNPKVSLSTKLRTIQNSGPIKCEMCGEFESFDTKSFESHHIIPLSQGGIDNIYNTVCLCGNCHRRIHSNIPFTFNLKWKMLLNVRNNLKNTTPYYVKKFDRLFNPYYNLLYHNDLSDDELLKQYQEEEKYYIEHKKEEDEKFLIEFNCFKK